MKYIDFKPLHIFVVVKFTDNSNNLKISYMFSSSNRSFTVTFPPWPSFVFVLYKLWIRRF